LIPSETSLYGSAKASRTNQASSKTDKLLGGSVPIVPVRSEKGARLSEIVYLAVEDVDLQNKSVAIRLNSFRGSLKTASSERTIPLSDKALEALQVLRQGKEADEAIFTRYARPRGADSASQMLMKRLRKVVKDPKKSIHSLRHSMKDALRNSGCPEELGKAILGHSDGSVASRYGSGCTETGYGKGLVSTRSTRVPASSRSITVPCLA
jgi:hypothetical protein